MGENEPRREDDALLEEHQGKAYGEDEGEGEREQALDEPADDDAE